MDPEPLKREGRVAREDDELAWKLLTLPGLWINP